MNTPSGNIPFPSSDRPTEGAWGASPSTSSATAEPASSPAGGPNAGMGRVVRGAHDTIDRVAEKAAPMLDHLKTRVSETQDTLHRRADEWMRMEHEMAESARARVRENPLTWVAVGVAAGMLLGRLGSSR